ncbi:Phosphomethylpyrimidine kinase, partial [mine drainage metagenome]
MSLEQAETALFIGGHDPSGGAGLTADIQTASALGVHPLTLITALTVQDTENVERIESVDPDWLEACFGKVVSDIHPACIKVGLWGSRSVGERLATLLGNMRPIPIVLDPIWKASGGFLLAQSGWADVVRDRLLPLTTLLTPNQTELLALAPSAATIDEAARALLAHGTGAILVTGGDQDPHCPYVTSLLYTQDGAIERWNDARLSDAFHGSGCTLAAACASYLARGYPLKMAVRAGLRWAHLALVKARPIGRGGR